MYPPNKDNVDDSIEVLTLWEAIEAKEQDNNMINAFSVRTVYGEMKNQKYSYDLPCSSCNGMYLRYYG